MMVLCADTTYCYQFWYLYFIIGMYMLLPLIKPWIVQNMQGEMPNTETLLLFSFVLLVGIIVPTVRRIMGITDSYWKGAFSVFSGLPFYLLCGCWLSKWLLPGYFRIALFGTWLLQAAWLILNAVNGNTDKISAWYGYGSFFTWEMSVLLFDTIHRFDFSKCNSLTMKLIRKLSADSLGIYIFHVMVMWILSKVPFMNHWGMPLANLLANVMVCVVICVFCTKVVRKIQPLRELV